MTKLVSFSRDAANVHCQRVILKPTECHQTSVEAKKDDNLHGSPQPTTMINHLFKRLTICLNDTVINDILVIKLIYLMTLRLFGREVSLL